MLAQGRAEVAEQGTSLVACGIPASGHTVRIIEPETLAQLADGSVGEIWTDGPSLPAATGGAPGKRRKLSSTTKVDAGCAQEILVLSTQGKLYIAGRHKDLIIIRGQNIYPQDLEQVVEEEVEAARKGRVAAFSVEP